MDVLYQLNQSFPHGFEPTRQDETEARVMLSRAVECVPHSAPGTSGLQPSAHFGEDYKKIDSQKDILGEMFFLKIFFRDSTILLLYTRLGVESRVTFSPKKTTEKVMSSRCKLR